MRIARSTRISTELSRPRRIGSRCSVFSSRLPDNTDKSFTYYGVDGVFVLLQYLFEGVVVDILAARIEGWIDVEPFVDSHCVNLVE
jgi:hypothetical protein